MKTTLDRELWRAIEAFDVDGGPAGLTFEARLARENGWTREFAAKVVGEYRRFVYLAARAGHPVTPSDEVDQAWHPHMTYTRSYWDRMCSDVLKKPLHHDPTRGGREEGVKFEDWYSKTKETYFRTFGEAPPRDVWPESAERFGDAPHFARINTRQYWMIRKPRSWRTPAVAAGAIAVTTAMAGCAANLGEAEMVWLGVGAFVVVAVLVGWAIRRGGGSDGSGCGGGFWWWGGGCGSSHDGGSSHDCGPDGGSSGCSASGCGGGGCGGGCGGD